VHYIARLPDGGWKNFCPPLFINKKLGILPTRERVWKEKNWGYQVIWW
jgi:hypothetical protein